MTHRFPIKEIAIQAGLSTATVDRVLNKRPNVSQQTSARVAAAIVELKGQEAQLAARGRRMFFDFVIEAPTRFSREVQRAAEQVSTQIGTAVCRLRFLNQEIMDEADVVKALGRIAKRGSHGVCLKARDAPLIRAAVNQLVAADIPVVTLVTDIQASGRIAYIGLDNESAGRTAAYLVSTALRDEFGTVLTVRSNSRFLGEEVRETAFASAIAKICPNMSLVAISGGSGVHYETSQVLDGIFDSLNDLKAVYSVGGGNRTILGMLKEHRFRPSIYLAHDLDQENRSLIEEKRLNFVLHHDLEVDMQSVFHTFLHNHKLVPNKPAHLISSVQIITPENIPPTSQPRN